MNEKETTKKEYITEEQIKEQSNKFKFIGNDGLLYTRDSKYFINED